MKWILKMLKKDKIAQLKQKLSKLMNYYDENSLNIAQLCILNNAQKCFEQIQFSQQLNEIRLKKIVYNDIELNIYHYFIFSIIVGDIYFVRRTKQFNANSDITVFQVSIKLYGNELFNYLWQDEDFIIKDLLQTNNIIELLVEYDLEELYAKILKLCDQNKQLYRQVYIQLSNFGRKFDESKQISKTLYVKINDILEKAILKEFDFSNEIVTIWENKVIETQFGTLSLKIAEKAAISQYEMLNLITGNDNEVDERFNEMNKKIRYLNHRINLRQIIQASFIRAQKLGIQNKQNLDMWFQCQNEQFTQSNLQVFKRNICRDEGIYNGLTLAQICIIEDNLGILNIIIYEEYHLNLKMTIIIKTDFGDTVIPAGSNLLQMAVILNSKNCLQNLLENGQQFNYLNQKSSEGESTYELSMRAKDKQSNIVIDDEQFLKNEMSNNSINGENILIKSLQYNNVHMLLKWESLMSRVDFTIDIMKMVLLKNKQGLSMIDVCQSLEAVRVTRQLTEQSINFIFDNYLYNDQYWRSILQQFFECSFHKFLQQRISLQQSQINFIREYQQDLTFILAPIQSIQYKPSNIQNYQTHYTQIQQSLSSFYEYFNVKSKSEINNKELDETNQNQVRIIDPLFVQNLKYLKRYAEEANFPQIKFDQRKTDYSKNIFNGFYLVHYAILNSDNEIINKLLKYDIYQRTISTVFINFQNEKVIKLFKNTSTLQLLIICQKVDIFCKICEQIILPVINCEILDLTDNNLQIIRLMLSNNDGNLNIIDYLFLAKENDNLQLVFQKILQVYFKHGSLEDIKFLKLLQLSIQTCLLQHVIFLNQIFDVFTKDLHYRFILSQQIIDYFEQEAVQQRLLYTPSNFNQQIEQFQMKVYSNVYLSKLDVVQQSNIAPYIEDKINYLQKPIYIKNIVKIEVYMSQQIDKVSSLKFLDSYIQEKKISQLFDAIVQGTFTIKELKSQLFSNLNIKELRQTNFESIFNGMNMLGYAILFGQIEYVKVLMNYQFDQNFDQQICFYINEQYVVFNCSCNYMLLAIISGSKEMFKLVLKQYQQNNISKINQGNLDILKISTLCKFDYFFYQKQLLYTELLNTKQYIYSDMNRQNPILYLFDNGHDNYFNIIIRQIQNSDQFDNIIQQIYISMVQRVNSNCLVDFILQYQNNQFLEQLCINAVVYTLQQSQIDVHLQQIMIQYYGDVNTFKEKQSYVINQQDPFSLYSKATNFLQVRDQFTINKNIQNIQDISIYNCIKHESYQCFVDLYKKQNIIFEERQTDILFQIFQGFAPIHYATLFGKIDILKFLIKSQGNILTQQNTYIQTQNKQLIYLPKQSSVFHIAIIIQNSDILKFLQPYFEFEWFNTVADTQQIINQETVKMPMIDNMPCFEFPLTKAACLFDFNLSTQIILCEFQKITDNKNSQEIKNCFSILCNSGNLKSIKHFFSLIQKFNSELAFDCLLYRFPSNYIEQLSLIQIIQKLSINQSININYIQELEYFIQSQQSIYNNKYTKQNNIQSFDLQSYYKIPQQFITKMYYNQYFYFQNPIIFDKNMHATQIANEQQYICYEDQIIKLVDNNDYMKINIHFGSLQLVDIKWLESCKNNDIETIKYNFSSQIGTVDYRSSNFKQQIYFGWSGLHYGILNNHVSVFNALIKQEYQIRTIVDQIIHFDDILYFVPKSSNYLEIICILGRKQLLHQVGFGYTRYCENLTPNIFNHTILDLFAFCGVFNIEIALKQYFYPEKIENYSQFCIKKNNLEFIKYISSQKQYQAQFYSFMIKEISKDQFPPKEIQNSVHLYLSFVFTQIQEYIIQKNLFKEEYISYFGQEEYFNLQQQYQVEKNLNLTNQIVIQTVHLLPIYKLKEQNLLENNNTQIENEWFDSCLSGDLQKITTLKGVKQYDTRLSNFKFDQYKGFTGLHYAVLNNQYEVSTILMQYEQNLKPIYDNIILLDNQHYLLKKNAKLIHMIIIFKFQKLLTYLKTKKLLLKNLDSSLMQISCIVDFLPDLYFLELFIQNSDFLFLKEIREGGDLQIGIIAYLESCNVQETSISLIQKIFELLTKENILFIKSVEFCLQNKRNQKIQHILQKFSNIKSTYIQLVKQYQKSTLCDYEETVRNSFLIENFKPSQNQPQNHYFDSIIDAQTCDIIEQVKAQKLTFDTRETTTKIIKGFCALFYAIYYKNNILARKLMYLENNFCLPFDTVLPNGFFVSKGAIWSQIAAICENGEILMLVKPKQNFDIRGLNYAYFLARKHIFTCLIADGVSSISGRKLAKWVQETRDQMLGVLLINRYTSLELARCFIREDQDDFVGRCIKCCFGEEIEGVKSGQFASKKQMMLWLMEGGGQ